MTQMSSTSEWIDKLVYPYSGVLLSSKEKQNTGTPNSVDESQMHYTKWKKKTSHKILHIL